MKTDNVVFEMLIGSLKAGKLNEVTSLLGKYSAPLILDNKLAGSGTLIKCGKAHGILTAHHVIHNPKDRSRVFDFRWSSKQQLGLTLVEYPHLFRIPMNSLHCVDIGVPQNGDECDGPDLSVIIFPENVISEITARKSFFNVSIRREERLAGCSNNNGLWCAVGNPKFYESSMLPSHGFSEVVDLRGIVLYTAISKRELRRDFDYIHLNVNYPDLVGDAALPDRFGGLSGGGVWRLSLIKATANSQPEIDLLSACLAGVVYCETLRDGRPEELRCHGPRSIYNRVCEALPSK